MIYKKLFFLIFLCGCVNNIDYKDNKIESQKATNYHLQLGLLYLKEGNKTRAKQNILSALEASPNSPDAHTSLAYYFEQIGNLSDADTFYKKAIRLKPKDGAILSNYGSFLCRQKRFKEALQVFDRALQDMHFYDSATVYENAGICAEQNKQLPLAKRYFLAAIGEDNSKVHSLIAALKISLLLNEEQDAKDIVNRFFALQKSSKELRKLASIINKLK